MELDALVKRRISDLRREASKGFTLGLKRDVFVATTLTKTPQRLQREEARRRREEEEADLVSDLSQARGSSAYETVKTSPPRRSKRVGELRRRESTKRETDQDSKIDRRPQKSRRATSMKRRTASSFDDAESTVKKGRGDGEDSRSPATRRYGEKVVPKGLQQEPGDPSVLTRSSLTRELTRELSDDDDFVKSTSSAATLEKRDEPVAPKSVSKASVLSTKRRRPRADSATPPVDFSAARELMPLQDSRARDASRESDEPLREPSPADVSSRSDSQPAIEEDDGYASRRALRSLGRDGRRRREDAHDSTSKAHDDQADDFSSDDVAGDVSLEALSLEIEKLEQKSHEKKTISSVRVDVKAALRQAHDYLSDWRANVSSRCEAFDHRKDIQSVMKSVVALESDVTAAVAKYDASFESRRDKEESLKRSVSEAFALVNSLEDDFKDDGEAFAKALERLKINCLRQVEEEIKLVSTRKTKTNRRDVFS